MKAPMLILFVAGASLSLALKSAIGHLATLEDRVRTLERTVQACCSTEYGLGADGESAHRAYVELKKRVSEIEKRMESQK